MAISWRSCARTILLGGLIVGSFAGSTGVGMGSSPRTAHAEFTSATATHVHAVDSATASAAVRFAHVPLAFEPLEDGGFAARTAGETIAVRGAHIFLVPAQNLHHSAVSITFQGAAANHSAVASQLSVTRSSYFLGDDPRAWRHQVPTYGRVTYDALYPGIDVTYYGTAEQIEYNLRVAAGADASRITFSVQNVGRIAVDRLGRLVLGSGPTATTLGRPVAYQVVHGRRVAVSSAYRLDARHNVGFSVGAYNHRLPLVIDPVLRYSTLFGSYDAVSALAVDPAGNAYAVGWVSGQIITTTSTLEAGTLVGSQDAFVAKLNPSGSHLVYSTYMGASSASGSGTAVAIAIDSHGDAYITGSTSSATFPTTLHAFQPRLRGATDAFVAKLSSDGQQLLYSTYLGGATDNADTTGTNAGTGIAVDGAGYAYVTGYTQGYDFPLRHAYQTALGYGKGTLGSQEDAFVTKLNPTGTGIVYSTYLGGSATDAAVGIALDKVGDAYVVGTTSSPDFPTTAHARQPSLLAGEDANIFVTKFNSSGTGLVFSTLMGKSSADKPHAIAVDPAGNAYIVGETTGGIPQTALGAQPSSGGGIDAFLMKMNPKGVLVYSTYLGGSGDDIGLGVALDGAGAAYVAGQTSSATFNTPIFPLSKALQGQLGGTRGGFGMIDAFVSKISPCGTALLYSSYLGGTFVDVANAIGVDRHGDAIIAGGTFSPNFPLAHPLTNGGTYAPPNSNAFVAMISNGPSASPHEVCPLPLTVDVPPTTNIRPSFSM